MTTPQQRPSLEAPRCCKLLSSINPQWALLNTNRQLAFFVGMRSLPTMVFSMQARMASMNYNVKVACISVCCG